MIETKIIFFGAFIQILIYMLVGLLNRDYKISISIFYVSVIIYLLIGAGLTIWNINSNTDFGECGTKVYNPLTIISILGNLINIGVLGLSYVWLKVLKACIYFWKEFGLYSILFKSKK